MYTQEIETKVKTIFEPTIDNAIRDMRIAKKLHLTKNNKFYSSIANEYMKDKEKFLPFVITDKKEEFMSEYSQIFQEVGNECDESIAYRLLNFEHSGDIMMLLNANTDWDLVDSTLEQQGHTGGTFNCLANKVLYFSPYGLDFIEHAFGSKERIQAEKEIKKANNLSTSKK